MAFTAQIKANNSAFHQNSPSHSMCNPAGRDSEEHAAVLEVSAAEESISRLPQADEICCFWIGRFRWNAESLHQSSMDQQFSHGNKVASRWTLYSSSMILQQVLKVASMCHLLVSGSTLASIYYWLTHWLQNLPSRIFMRVSVTETLLT